MWAACGLLCPFPGRSSEITRMPSSWRTAGSSTALSRRLLDVLPPAQNPSKLRILGSIPKPQLFTQTINMIEGSQDGGSQNARVIQKTVLSAQCSTPGMKS